MGTEISKEQKRREESEAYVRQLAARQQSQPYRERIVGRSTTAAETTSRADDAVEASNVYRYTSQQLKSMSGGRPTRLYPDLARAEHSEIQARVANGSSSAPAPGCEVAGASQVTRAPPPSSTSCTTAGQFCEEPRGREELARGCGSGYEASVSAPQARPGTASRNAVDDFEFVNKPHGAGRPRPSAPPERELSSSRSSSVTRGGAAGAAEERCATCERPFQLEVYQCAGGHSTCAACRQRGATCARCGLAVLAMRNYALEDHIREKRVECPNSEFGCVLRPRRVDLPSHLAECIFRVMACPLASVYGLCTWTGRRGVEMVRHLDERHEVHRRAAVDREMSLRRLDRDDRITHCVLLDAYLFLVHIRISEASQMLHFAVQLIGTKSGASKWKYELNIFNRDEPRRKLEYHDACTAEGDDIGRVFAESRCLVLPLAYVRGYTAQHGVSYKFYITKEEAPRAQQAGRGGRGGRGARGVRGGRGGRGGRDR